MDTTEVMLPQVKEGCKRLPYAPISIQCANALVAKGEYDEFSIVHNKLITLYIFHESCSFESRVFSYNNSPKCMLHII